MGNAEHADSTFTASTEWNRLVWQSIAKTLELWPATLGKRSRPKQLQGRLRRELEPLIWVRVDVQKWPSDNAIQHRGESGLMESQSVWEREHLVRCHRASDKIEVTRKGQNSRSIADSMTECSICEASDEKDV